MAKPAEIGTVANQIASRLYEGILVPGEWCAALDGIRAAIDGAVFHHLAWDYLHQCVVPGSVTNDLSAGDEHKIRAYEEHYAAIDPRIPHVMTMPVGGIQLIHEYFSPQAMSRSAFFMDWLVPLGFRHSLGVPVYDDGATRELFTVLRPADQRPFDEDTRALLQALMPDFLRAARLRVRTTELARRAALSTAALDALPQPLAVADAGLHLRYLNVAAERMPAGPGGLALRHGVLRASDPATQCHLAQGAAVACGVDGSARAGTVRIAPAGGHAPGPVTVHVLPLQASHPLAQALHGIPHALLVWAAPLSSHKVTHIGMALGLSEAEARLALMLAQGLTVKDFAQAQGCTWHTARTHARNLLRKTGCHRQVDVVRLVQSLLWA